MVFFFNDTATTEIYTLSLHDALPIYLAISYVLSVPLLLDKNLDFWPAMETSRKLVGKKWFAFFGFVLVLGLVNIVGALCVGLGLLVTLPWTVCTMTAAYEDIVGLNSVAEAA